MTDAIATPHLTFSDGHTIPQFGLGVWQIDDAEAERVVGEALEVGYRHIDTARVYKNETGVGKAIAASGIPRDELFITTKLWNSDQGRDTVRAAAEASLERLGLEKVDLYLIHWPAPKYGKHVESWEAMIEVRDAGLATSIGVSNFMQTHLDDLAAATDVVPVVNQVELHPAFQQRDLRAFHAERGILTESWSPLGDGRKTVQQIAIRWHLQEGLIVFPKTVRRERMLENAAVFDFELTADDMATIAAADRDQRVGAHPLNTDF